MKKLMLFSMMLILFSSFALAANCAPDLTSEQWEILKAAEQNPGASDFNYSVLTFARKTLVILGDAKVKRFETGVALSRFEMKSDRAVSTPLPEEGLLKSFLPDVSDKWVLDNGICLTQIDVEKPDQSKLVENGRPVLRFLAGVVATASSVIFVKEICNGVVDPSAAKAALGAATLSLLANPNYGLIGRSAREDYIERLAKAISQSARRTLVIYIPNRWFHQIDALLRQEGWTLHSGNHG